MRTFLFSKSVAVHRNQGGDYVVCHVDFHVCMQTSPCFFTPFSCVCMIDSILRIHKEGEEERKMYFDSLCKCNGTISPQALHIVCSKKCKHSEKKKKMSVLTRTQQYLSKFLYPPPHTALTTFQFPRVKKRSNNVWGLPVI